MKRFIALAAIALLAMNAAACTREKPPVVEPSPTGQLALGTPLPTLSGGAVVSPTPVDLGTVTAPTSETPVPGAATPVPTAAPTMIVLETAVPTSGPPPSASGGATMYTVQWGDWLNKIAQKFGTTTQALMAANPGLDPNRIVPGQVLNIPAAGSAPTGGSSAPAGSPNTYTVQRGDWFYSIARKFGVSVAALQAANPTVNPNFVYPGQVLSIPGSSGAPAPAPAPSTSGGNTYTVRAGDTLYSIAVRFGKTVYALQIANHLPNPNAIYPGQTLVIP